MLKNHYFLRRKFIKNIIFGTSTVSLSGIIGFFRFNSSEVITVDTQFQSLKHPNISYTNINDFWNAHSECNSIDEDSFDKPNLLTQRKRVFMKICNKTGNIISRVQYKNRDAYLSHLQFLSEKYGLKVKQKGSSQYICSSKELLSIDVIT